MNRSEEVYKGATLAAPPLIVWASTQRGWNMATEIITSNLLSKSQLYGINTLRPMSEFEIQRPVLGNVAKYYAVISQLLLEGPLVAAVENGKAFVWSSRSFDKGESIPTVRFHHYTCHSARAELCVAAYNVAVAMMQLVVLTMSGLHDNPDVLRASIQLTGNAERIFLGLMEFANLSSISQVSPQDPRPAPFVSPKHLQLLADWSFAQLCELWFVHYTTQMDMDKVIAIGLTIVDTYEALYTIVKEKDDLNSIVPGFLQRLIATKRRYYMLQTASFFIHGTDYEMDATMLASLETMALQTLEGLDKFPAPLSGVSSSIRADIESIRETYQTVQYKESKTSTEVLWSLVRQYTVPSVPSNSIRNSELASNPALAPATSIAELHAKIKTLVPRLWLVAERGIWSAKPEETDAALKQAFYNSIAPLLPQVIVPSQVVLSAPSNQQSSSTAGLIDQRFAKKIFLFERLRRLGTLMTTLANISTILQSLKAQSSSGGDDKSTPPSTSKLEIILQNFFQQIIDYTQVIECIFFDHSKGGSSSTDAVANVVNPRDITTLAKAIVDPNHGAVAEIDDTLLSKALDDSDTQPAIETVENIEKMLRDEMRPIWIHVKTLGGGAAPPQ